MVAPRIDPIETSDAGNKVEVLLGGEETWRRLLLGDDPDGSRTRMGSSTTSRPITRADPDVGLTCPVSILIIVVLPEPFGPSRPKSPLTIERDISSTAVTVPCCFVRVSAPII